MNPPRDLAVGLQWFHQCPAVGTYLVFRFLIEVVFYLLRDWLKPTQGKLRKVRLEPDSQLSDRAKWEVGKVPLGKAEEPAGICPGMAPP